MTTHRLAQVLTEKQITFRYSERYKPLMGGCAVIVSNSVVWRWGALSAYQIGIMNGSLNQVYTFGKEVSLVFNPQAFKDDTYCSASGGPGTILTPVECLQFTGLKVEQEFWRWKDGHAQAHYRLSYKEFVPLYHFYQSREEAQMPGKTLTSSEFKALQSATFPGDEYNLTVNPESFEAGWVQDEHKQLRYWQQVKHAFATPELVSQTSKSLVMPVCYEMTYKDVRNKWYKPNEYFIQDMHVSDPNGDPLPSLLGNDPNHAYLASPYFLPAEVKAKRLSIVGMRVS